MLYYPSNGRPAIAIRMMVVLHYLKHLHNLSDEQAARRWRENPYWQYFSGGEYFEHKFPFDSSSMSRWRKRISVDGMLAMLQETLAVAHQRGVFKMSSLSQIIAGRVLDGSEVAVDLGYRGHKCKNVTVFHPRLKRISPRIRKFVRSSSKIEAIIAGLKLRHRMGRNFLKGQIGDRLNAILAACAHNLGITLRHYLT